MRKTIKQSQPIQLSRESFNSRQQTADWRLRRSALQPAFTGFNDSGSLKVDKNIDAISGATISVYTITADVENKTALLKKLQL
nr:hypothetical protein [uncultured Draconibacterium sp.]